nr:aminotransferase class III-fold pyridoxal phosphate-dependent enzyme [Bacillus altitudinis]
MGFEEFGEEIGGVIVEGVGGNMGVVRGQEGLLEGLREMSEEYGCLVIFDEVMRGLGVDYDCGEGYFGIRCDLRCVGKVMGGGVGVGG